MQFPPTALHGLGHPATYTAIPLLGEADLPIYDATTSFQMWCLINMYLKTIRLKLSDNPRGMCLSSISYESSDLEKILNHENKGLAGILVNTFPLQNCFFTL